MKPTILPLVLGLLLAGCAGAPARLEGNERTRIESRRERLEREMRADLARELTDALVVPVLFLGLGACR